MSAPRILISGDTGFVGTHLLAALKTADAEIFPFVDMGNGSRIDLRDKAGIETLVQNVQPTAVIHLAAVASPREARADPQSAWQINLEGTLNIAQAIRTHAATARLIFAGSSEAYGASFNKVAGPVTEDTALLPMSAYGATKAACDVALGQLHYEGVRIVRFRPFNHTGPGQTSAYVVPAFAEQVARIEAGLQEPTLSVGNLGAERDFLDVADVVRAYADAALGRAGTDGEVYNLSTGAPTTIAAMLDMLRSMSRRQFDVVIDPARWTENAVPRASGSYEKAERGWGWRPMISLEETVRRVLDDCRSMLIS